MNRRIYDQEQHAHFVTFSCYHRRRMLDCEPLRDTLLELLAQKLSEYSGICSGYVVMPDHVHIIVWFEAEGCAACQGPQLAYRNGTMYSSYTAAVFARKYELAARHGVNLEGALTWAFEFENQPLFAGFRSLATGGIDKPVLNVFRIFSLLQGQRIEATSDAQVPLDEIMQHGVRERPDVGILATRQDDTLSILVWHYHDDDLPGPAANIRLVISDYLPAGEPEKRMVQHYRVDRKHSNAFEVWKEQSSPAQPTAAQYAELERTMKLAEFTGPMTLKAENGANVVEFSLPRGGVSLVRVGRQ